MDTKNEFLIKLKQDLERRNYSAQTEKRYNYIVGYFFDYMETIDSDKQITEYDENDVIDFLKYLVDVHHYKNSSYNNVNSILKFFLETTLEKNIGYRRLPNRKVEVRLKVVPSKETIEKIIDSTDNLKHKCWYSFAYGSGLRVSEIAKLKLKDIDVVNLKVNVIGKGNKERLTLLAKKTLILFNQYIEEENIKDPESYLFKGQNRDYISEGSISRSLSDLVKKMGIEEQITIHSFRRSFATHLLRSGVSIEVVKELMGHNSLTTTSGYVQYVYRELEIKNPLDD